MSKNLISRYLPRTLFHSVCLLVVLCFLAFSTILIDGFHASCLKQNNRNIDHEYDWNEISELIREFLTKNDGRFPRSFTEISEEVDEKFGGNYAFLTDYSSSKRSVNRACVIERIPLRRFFKIAAPTILQRRTSRDQDR